MPCRKLGNCIARGRCRFNAKDAKLVPLFSRTTPRTDCSLPVKWVTPVEKCGIKVDDAPLALARRFLPHSWTAGLGPAQA